MPGQGIDAGDAVLNFIADTTSLDAAFADVSANTDSKLEPARAKLEEVAGAWQFAGSTASTAGHQAEEAGEEMVDAAEKSSKATGEARGEAALLGEAFGVRLPRHVRSFVAELPGVSDQLCLGPLHIHRGDEGIHRRGDRQQRGAGKAGGRVQAS
jgi:hypothetical protein